MSNTAMALFWLFLLTSFMVVPAHANLAYTSNSTDTKQCIDHNKPPKKKSVKERIKRAEKWWFSFKHPSNTQAVSDWGELGMVLGVLLILLSLFFPGVAFIVGGISGMLGWWIAGSIVAGLWLGLCFIFTLVNTDYNGAGDIFSFIIYVASIILYGSLLIWALNTMMPVLAALSIIFGSIALIGILIHIFKYFLN